MRRGQADDGVGLMLVAAEGAVVVQIARRWQICPSQVFTTSGRANT